MKLLKIAVLFLFSIVGAAFVCEKFDGVVIHSAEAGDSEGAHSNGRG